jgi:hypothetical protein
MNEEQALQTEIIQAEFIQPSALEAIQRAEIDVQIATARRYPRDLRLVKKTILELATMDAETAAGCFYVLKRKNADGTPTKIEGPSVRLAEIVFTTYGNARAASRIMGEDDHFITAQGVCIDLQSNAAVSMETKRRITSRSGKRYGDDMIATTGNAAGAIAFRNAVFKVVPASVWKPALEAAKKVAVGDLRSLVQRRTECVGAFSKMGVGGEQLAAYVGKERVDEIGLDELEELRGLFTSLRDGDTSLEEAFPPAKAAEKPGTGKVNLADLKASADQTVPRGGDGAKKAGSTPAGASTVAAGRAAEMGEQGPGPAQREQPEEPPTEADPEAGDAQEPPEPPQAAAPPSAPVPAPAGSKPGPRPVFGLKPRGGA